MFQVKCVKESIDVSSRSLSNLEVELSSIRKIANTMEDAEEIKAFTDEALQEVVYNIRLLADGVEYKSDEYAYIFDSLRECE